MPTETDELTTSERRVLRLLAHGHTQQFIAGALGVSVETVHTHLKHVYEKFAVHHRDAAVARYWNEVSPRESPEIGDALSSDHF